MQNPEIRVLHVTYDMQIGGTEQVIRQLINGLDKQRFINTILCLDGLIGALGTELQSDGIEFIVMDRQPGFDRKLVRQLRQLIRERQFDIVHCHQYTPFSYAALACLFNHRPLIVFTEHGRFHPDRFSWKRRLINQVLAYRADAITAISAATREALAHYEWFRRSRIQLIYNGVAQIRSIETTHDQSSDNDIPTNQIKSGAQPLSAKSAARQMREKLGIATDDLVLGTVARLDTIKNQSMMIAALAALIRRHPNTHLLLIGDGPERQALEKQTAELGLAPYVHFTGFQNNPAPWYALMDVFLLTSLSEGTSMTLLEALSASRVCVVTDVGGNVEIITHQDNGLVVESKNVGQLVVVLEELLDNTELRSRYATRARQSFEQRFKLGQMIHSYETLYNSMIPAIQPLNSKPSC
ncbi:MAG: glycosyltransferase [Granulosicoccus sp.]